jgi:RAB protein geranylgeranyltransferase component A
MPNGREDVFSDKSIDVRAKRGLMKFLKFVIDYENQTELWKDHENESLPSFLSSQFQLAESMQTVILSLTLSFTKPSETTVGYSLPRIARHLTSIGVFGPGFGAVIPKWGGCAEIAQVACRAGAVGGGVYVLGTGSANVTSSSATELEVELTNSDTVRAKSYVSTADVHVAETLSPHTGVAKLTTVVSADLSGLFTPTVEGSPQAAVSVVCFPAMTICADRTRSEHPIYAMVHSSETGECPRGQCKFQSCLFSPCIL